jgi:nicotinate-nucleotide adenylyltransferase
VSWTGVTALFGGTFDPPHRGHRIALNGLFSDPGVARVLVLPSPSPPHKPTVASPEDRLEMARLNFAEVSGTDRLKGLVQIEECELRRGERNPDSPTYTYDTLLELKPQFPHLAFVIGTDQLVKFPTWKRFKDLLGLCHWVILDRQAEKVPSGGLQSGALALSERELSQWEGSGMVRRDGPQRWKTPAGTQLQIVKTLAPALSSTRIRESLVLTGKPPEGSLLPEVQAYLMQRGIYGTRTPQEILK